MPPRKDLSLKRKENPVSPAPEERKQTKNERRVLPHEDPQPKIEVHLEPKKKHSDYQEEVVKSILYLSNHIAPSRTNDPKRFYCRLCGSKTLEFHEPFWDNLTTHLIGNTHVTLCNDEIGRIDALRLLKERKKKKSTKSKLEQESINRELKFKFTCFLLQNALPFNFVDELVLFCKDVVHTYDREDLDNFIISKTTATKIAQNCIGTCLKEAILNDLALFPFSLMVDECSDPFGDSYIAITAQYLKDKHIQTKLVSIIELQSEKTGLAFYELITQELFSGERGISIGNNCMGICTDRGANMLAKRKGLSNRLQQTFPHMYVVHDYSHIFNLIGKQAAKAFPANIPEMIKDISKHFSYSTSHLSKLEQIQLASGVPNNKVKTMVRHTDVRWFSSLQTARRIVQIWEYLVLYFTDGDYDEIDYFTGSNKTYLKLYILLMGSLDFYNKSFQQEGITYSDIGPLLRECFLLYAKLLCDSQYTSANPRQEFDVYFTMDFGEDLELNLEAFGRRLSNEYPLIEESLEMSSFEDIKAVLEVAKNFFIKVIHQLKLRVPFNDDIVNHGTRSSSNIQILFLETYKRTLCKRQGVFKRVVTQSKFNLRFQKSVNLAL